MIRHGRACARLMGALNTPGSFFLSVHLAKGSFQSHNRKEKKKKKMAGTLGCSHM